MFNNNSNYRFGSVDSLLDFMNTNPGWNPSKGIGNGSSTNSLNSFMENYGGLMKGGFDVFKALGSMYMANKQLGMARDQFNFTKDFANRNMANQTKTYNTNLEHQYARSIAANDWSQEQKQNSIQEYLNKHRL